VVLLAGACSPGNVVVGGTGGGSAGAGGSGGGPSVTCSEEAKTVYVIALDNTFSAFDPRTKTFRDIGMLSCPGSTGAPFSMAVARDANAYVLYDSGQLFKVATSNLACTATGFMPDATYRTFGMGFSTQTANSSSDQLFIAGGQSVAATSKLGRLDVTSFMATGQVDLSGWPELTGTGDGQLWGFFPQTAAGGGSPRVARLNKTTGALSPDYPAAMLAGSATAWAFAFWGGSFWIFLKRDTETSTSVWDMKANSGSVSNALVDTGRVIVGAGVSTCAPIN
jgi:hypothetical protein